MNRLLPQHWVQVSETCGAVFLTAFLVAAYYLWCTIKSNLDFNLSVLYVIHGTQYNIQSLLITSELYSTNFLGCREILDSYIYISIYMVQCTTFVQPPRPVFVRIVSPFCPAAVQNGASSMSVKRHICMQTAGICFGSTCFGLCSDMYLDDYLWNLKIHIRFCESFFCEYNKI